MNDPNDMMVKDFKFYSDGFCLHGYLHLPHRTHPPMVIGSHGLLSNGSSPKLIELARQCTRQGQGFFRFDHRGCGDSEGDILEGTSLQARRSDLMSAIKALRQAGYANNKIALFGSSMGGATAIATANQIAVDGLVLYAAPVEPLTHLPADRVPSVQAKDGSVSHIRLSSDLSLNLSALHHVLVIHGDADPIVPISHAWKIYKAAQQPKRILIQKGGDHPMSLPDHQRAFAREAVYWFNVCFRHG